MKKNKLSIEINKPIEKVFEFTTNPDNTGVWIDGIVKEETDKQPIKVGTKYRNLNKAGEWTEYEVVALEENKLFELHHIGGSYSVRYTYEPINNGNVKLTYFEWDEKGLDNPFSQKVLKKLKSILENKFELGL